jgi:sulfonate transport system ATP-binding protein
MSPAVIAQTLRSMEDFVDLASDRAEPDADVSGLAITARGLQKSFGPNQVLRGVSFHIRAGQFVAIVGRSGCGKSTLLRLLLGLDQPTQGQFWFGDDPQTPPERDAIRIMFQEPRLLPWASVLANVEVGLGKDSASADARGRAIATLRHVGLKDRRKDWPSELSGGQKQRVALARALVSCPRALVFDEPLGALDALTRISMQRLLERVWLRQKFTAVMVTHDVTEAVMLADRVLMIEEGEIAFDLRIDLPRPRERGSAEVAALEGRILSDLFRNSPVAEDA